MRVFLIYEQRIGFFVAFFGTGLPWFDWEEKDILLQLRWKSCRNKMKKLDIKGGGEEGDEESNDCLWNRLVSCEKVEIVGQMMKQNGKTSGPR